MELSSTVKPRILAIKVEILAVMVVIMFFRGGKLDGGDVIFGRIEFTFQVLKCQ